MRLFVAVNLPAPVRHALALLSTELEALDLPVRWVGADTYHLTLRWLGDGDERTRDDAAAAMREVAADAEPFTAGFGAVGAFPSPRRPRVIWVAVEADPRLRLLREELERSFARRGLGRDERSFRPHVTLGRASRDAPAGAFRPLAAVPEARSLDTRFPVLSLDLMRSTLGPHGARYDLLASATLGAKDFPRTSAACSLDR